ncbi:MAG TPA: 23S rRNA (uracil(1939)-C(5))-methyltransferase RlmD, partial [Gammaproteobacteria bacterium]|nr:23S rRNA (uracil(1939)-C(5))-methyltransferase RlmD [Gammaproteobacteria bacterium]
QPGGPQTVHRIGAQSDSELSYTLNMNPDIRLEFSPLDFIQVNAGINQLMVNRVLEVLDLTPSDNVLDLFSGLGNFTLPMARKANSVVGVEGSQEMVERLLANAARNGLQNVSAYAWDLTKPIGHLPWSKQTFDKIVLDPPRAGALEIVQQIKQFNAKTIVYISCHIATLARDSKIILEQGYRLKAAGVIDMFPHTMHVESMAVFVKQ